MTWAWSGWVVPCWVRSGSVCVFGCLRFCAFPLGVLVGSSESASTKQTRATTTHTHTRRSRALRTPSARIMLHAAWACVLGVRPFILVGVHYKRALCVSHPLNQYSSVAAPTQPLGSPLWLSSAPRPRLRPNCEHDDHHHVQQHQHHHSSHPPFSCHTGSSAAGWRTRPGSYSGCRPATAVRG